MVNPSNPGQKEELSLWEVRALEKRVFSELGHVTDTIKDIAGQLKITLDQIQRLNNQIAEDHSKYLLAINFEEKHQKLIDILEKLQDRIEAQERWRSYVMGVVAAAGFVGGLLGAIFSFIFHH